jgi:hypothetical protein
VKIQTLLAVGCISYFLFLSKASAQELEPRAYWITPKGSNAVFFAFTHLQGDIVFHPTLPFRDIDAQLNVFTVGYYRAIDFFGRSANFSVTLPFVSTDQEGFFLDNFQTVHRSGMADLQLRFSVNLLGAKAMTGAEFKQFREAPKTILGASIRIEAPSGQYDATRIISTGSNRWAFKPQIGFVQPFRKKFLIEMALGAWFYTENRDYLGETWKQDPLISSELHLVWRIQPALWAALDVNYYWGGRASLGQEQLPTIQGNSRIGGTVSLPFWGLQSIRIAAGSGFFARHGDRLGFISVTYQFGFL